MSKRPFTTRAITSLELADKSAGELNHGYIGTEHLLLGLVDERKGIAAQLLRKYGVTSEVVRRELREIFENSARADNASPPDPIL